MKTKLTFGFHLKSEMEKFHVIDPPVGKSVLCLVRSPIGKHYMDIRTWTGEKWIKTPPSGEVIGWQRIEMDEGL